MIILFGALTFLAGVVLMIKPDIVFGFLRKNLEKTSLYFLAIVVRIVLGVILIYQSDVSRFPMTIQIIGWLSIIAALSFFVIRHEKFKRLMQWALSLGDSVSRMGGSAAIVFGAFLIYAFI